MQADVPFYQPLSRANTLAWEPPVVEGVLRDDTILVPTSSSDDLSLSNLLGVGKPADLSWSTLAREEEEKQQKQKQQQKEQEASAMYGYNLFEFGSASNELDPLDLEFGSLSASGSSSDARGHSSPVAWDEYGYDDHGLYSTIANQYESFSSSTSNASTPAHFEEQERCVHLSDLVSSGPNDTTTPNNSHYRTDRSHAPSTTSTLKRKRLPSARAKAPLAKASRQRSVSATPSSSGDSNASDYQVSRAGSSPSSDDQDEYQVSSNHSPSRRRRPHASSANSPKRRRDNATGATDKDGNRNKNAPKISAAELPRYPLGIPVPVPNLTKKSRGRKVPAVDQSTSAATNDATARGSGDKGDTKQGERRTYTCQVPGCGKCFVRGEHLKRHVRSIHTYEKPHTCPFDGCDKAFSRRDNLAQHLKVHQ